MLFTVVTEQVILGWMILYIMYSQYKFLYYYICVDLSFGTIMQSHGADVDSLA